MKSSLQYLEKFFDLEKIAKEERQKEDIIRYYAINSFAYSVVHNREFTHMGLTKPNNSFHKSDLKKQLFYIEKYINKKTGNILELACGRGANSINLSKKYCNISFNGIDISLKQLSYAKKQNTKKNLKFSKGDYHDLSIFSNNSFDIVFVIEALCHSDNKNQVFKEVSRILKKGGIFIIIDGYSNIPNDKLTNQEKISLILTAKGMHFNKPVYYNDIVLLAKKQGFALIKERDKSKEALPSMERIKKRIIRLSKYGILSKIIFKMIPKKVSYNFISGYLMPELVRSKIATYMISIFKK